MGEGMGAGAAAELEGRAAGRVCAGSNVAARATGRNKPAMSRRFMERRGGKEAGNNRGKGLYTPSEQVRVFGRLGGAAGCGGYEAPRRGRRKKRGIRGNHRENARGPEA